VARHACIIFSNVQFKFHPAFIIALLVSKISFYMQCTMCMSLQRDVALCACAKNMRLYNADSGRVCLCRRGEEC
jgi:hypothetical protein